MTVFLPDTSALIDALNGRGDRKKMLHELVAQGHSLACCAVTVSELYAGLRPDEIGRAEKLLSLLVWTETSFTIARKAGELRYEWARKGKTLGLGDTLIAATALHYRLTLITDNKKDFPMPELSMHPLDAGGRP
jgi:predicted nucleic acid-binding protein